MLLHTTIEKRRSRAFKQYKVYQNLTIIKEVRSKNVILLPQCPAWGPRRIRPRVRPRQIRPRVRPWWIQPRVQPWPRRIRPQVLTSNFLLALAPGLDTGSRPQAGHRVWTPGWTQGPNPRLDTGSEPQPDTAGAGLHF